MKPGFKHYNLCCALTHRVRRKVGFQCLGFKLKLAMLSKLVKAEFLRHFRSQHRFLILGSPIITQILWNPCIHFKTKTVQEKKNNPHKCSIKRNPQSVIKYISAGKEQNICHNVTTSKSAHDH